jgi:hypothetical protein
MVNKHIYESHSILKMKMFHDCRKPGRGKWEETTGNVASYHLKVD